MKIISHGNPAPPPTPKWPLGHQFSCPACGCVFELELRDGADPVNGGAQYILETERRPGGRSEMRTFCPECREWTSYGRKPTLPNAADPRLLVDLRRGAI